MKLNKTSTHSFRIIISKCCCYNDQHRMSVDDEQHYLDMIILKLRVDFLFNFIYTSNPYWLDLDVLQ